MNESYMYYILLILGFAALIKGADLFVDGSSGIAKIMKIPSLIIGLNLTFVPSISSHP